MTRFETSKGRFSCRTAAIILHEDCVLLQGEPYARMWTLPGGGIELLEPSEQALKREMREELHVTIRIERLLWIIEHFFVSDEDGKEIHALGFYYLVIALDAPHLYHLERTFPATDGEREIIFQWFKLDSLPKLMLYPSFLRTALQSLPLSVEHRVIIHED